VIILKNQETMRRFTVLKPTALPINNVVNRTRRLLHLPRPGRTTVEQRSYECGVNLDHLRLVTTYQDNVNSGTHPLRANERCGGRSRTTHAVGGDTVIDSAIVDSQFAVGRVRD
jgi:hypothetical protein